MPISKSTIKFWTIMTICRTCWLLPIWQSAEAVCIPYPYHKDRHQYLNAGKLVEAGAAIIVDDLPDNKETAEWLWEELEPLLKDEIKRRQMANACESIANKEAASKIAKKLLQTKE